MSIRIHINNRSTRRFSPTIKNKSVGFFFLIVFLFIGGFGMFSVYQANLNAEHYKGTVQSVEYRPNTSCSYSPNPILIKNVVNMRF